MATSRKKQERQGDEHDPQARAGMMLRLPPNTMEMLRLFAKQRGRSITREVQYALDLHVTESVLDSLDDDEFVTGVLGLTPDDLDPFRAEVEQDVLMLRAQAFARPMPVDKLAALLRL